MPRANLVPKPPGLSFEEAACLPTAYLTAYRMLFTMAGVKPGDRVLVQGAGGGVATALVLLAKAAGLHVSVTSRDEAKLARVRELGADVALPAGSRLARPGGRRHGDGRRGDLEPLAEFTPTRRDGGGQRRDVRAGPGADRAEPGVLPPAPGPRLDHGEPRELAALTRFLEVTGVRPLIDRTLPFADARQGFAALAAGDVFGKIVLTF